MFTLALNQSKPDAGNAAPIRVLHLGGDVREEPDDVPVVGGVNTRTNRGRMLRPANGPRACVVRIKRTGESHGRS